MIILKNDREAQGMREAGAVAGTVLDEVAAWIRPGLTTRAIDAYAASRIEDRKSVV